jgi:hypothetical protein
MKANRPQENTPRVLACAIAFFGGLAALGILDGTFDRLGLETVLVLAAFATGFALLTYVLDSGVRRTVNGLFAPRAARKGSDGRAAAV